jgi:uncharacterized membrane protein YdjX (TVP38/TMEM64 family)
MPGQEKRVRKATTPHGSPAAAPPEARTGPHRVRPSLIVIAAIGLVVAAVLALGLLRGSFIDVWHEWSRMHDIDELARSIRASGNWGVAVSIGLMVVHSFIPFPAEVVALANGIIYGTTFGTLITWTGAMLGAQAAFWTARSFGEPIVERFVRADRRVRVDRWIAKNGTAALLTMRLIPVIAFNLINYAAGLANVRWWTFTWTTALGILPLAFLMVAAGDQLKNVPLGLVAALVLGGLLMWALVKWLHKRHARPSRRS